MHAFLKSALATAAFAFAAQAAAQVTFYEHEGFEGRSFTTEQQVNNLQRRGFNDRASSAVVLRGRWEVCEGHASMAAALCCAPAGIRRSPRWA